MHVNKSAYKQICTFWCNNRTNIDQYDIWFSEGAIGVGLTKGDLVELEQPYEHFMNEDVYSATCVKTGKLNMMPRDLIYVIPTVEEPAHDTLVRMHLISYVLLHIIIIGFWW